MTEQDLILAISAAVKDPTNKLAVARSCMMLAIGRMGRMTGVDWNREWVEFNLKAGQSKYALGVDVIAKYPKIWNLQELYRRDVQQAIPIVSLDEFNRVARGSHFPNSYPQIATIHSSSAILEIFPAPSGDFPVGAYVQKAVAQLADIPDTYHDAVYNYAVALVYSTYDPILANRLAKDGFNEVQQDSQLAWDGDIISLDRPIDNTTRKTHDSHNLLGA